MIDNENKYTKMQQWYFDNEANKWSLDYIDAVVGSFNAHNEWPDYETYLWKDIDNLKDKTVLDFGCGPARNLVRWANDVKRIDGVDISDVNLQNGKIWISANNLDVDNFTLYKGDGVSIESVPSDAYDIVMSTIAMQHICVHEIRYNLFKEFYRTLKSGGKITMQMAYGPQVPNKNSVDYYDNYYDATTTNGHADTRVEDPNQLKNDLEKIGFKNFNHYIRPAGPGDDHPNWIFFNAEK